MFGHYKDRPTDSFGAGKYSVANKMCFAKSLKVHWCRFENLHISLPSYENNNMLKILH